MENKDIGYVLGFVADIGNGARMSINGNMREDDTVDAMNIKVDKIRKVIDRQQAKSAARGAEEEIEVLILRKKSATDDLASVDAKGGAVGMSSAEKQQRGAAISHIEKMGEDIDYKQKVLARLKDEAE